MKKLLSLGLVAAFAIGVAMGVETQSANALSLCWAYCNADNVLVMCCRFGCWVTGTPCSF